MKILVTGDKHLGLVSDGMPRLEEQERIIGACLKILHAEQPDIYVDLGDLFDSPRPGPAATALAVRYATLIAEWNVAGRAAYFLVGNHDKPTRGPVHALAPLAELHAKDPRYPRIVAEPAFDRVGDTLIALLPFVTGWEARQQNDHWDPQAWLDHAAVQALADSAAPVVVFTHLEVPGATHSADDRSQRDVGTAIPKRLLEDARVLRIYAGHVHRYQELDRVTVVGSALHVDFGEAEDPKGVVVAVI